MQTTLFLSRDTHVDNRTHLLIEVVKAFAGTAPPHQEQSKLFVSNNFFFFKSAISAYTHTQKAIFPSKTLTIYGRSPSFLLKVFVQFVLQHLVF